jgi:hypothetical protein
MVAVLPFKNLSDDSAQDYFSDGIAEGAGDRQAIPMRKARIALARRLAIIMHAMLRHGTEFKPA